MFIRDSSWNLCKSPDFQIWSNRNVRGPAKRPPADPHWETLWVVRAVALPAYLQSNLVPPNCKWLFCVIKHPLRNSWYYEFYVWECCSEFLKHLCSLRSSALLVSCTALLSEKYSKFISTPSHCILLQGLRVALLFSPFISSPSIWRLKL